MKANRSVKALMAVASLTVLTLGASGAAHAHGDNIFWSIGMSSPGVQVGVANVPPMVVMQPPIYMAPRPVVYMPPAPVYYGPPGWQHRHGHGWDRGHREYGHERYGHDRGGRGEGRR